MQRKLYSLKSEIENRLGSCHSEKEIEDVRIAFLGKKGSFTSILKDIGNLSADQRAIMGDLANTVKKEIYILFEKRKEALEEEYYQGLQSKEWFDMSLYPPEFPDQLVIKNGAGHIHPISLLEEELEQIFTSMGFSVLDGPQVETDFYNFAALNFSEDHPARDSQDTFYTTEGNLLRTHTSSVQIRGMLEFEPPIRMVAPGRVFRYEEIDASHEHTFYQVEGMVIDKNVSVSHLLYFMQTLLKEVFQKEVEVRLRPGYFPFVEPGFELDIQCLICMGKGCQVCKKSGWVELLPCGLVHPNVIKACKLDPLKWQGAAFGLGLNRLAMMRYGIEDIRYFQGSNMDFLSQF